LQKLSTDELNSLIRELGRNLETLYDTEGQYRRAYNVSEEEAKKALTEFRKVKDEAQRGQVPARNYIIGKYAILMNERNASKTINKQLDKIFENIDLVDFHNNTPNVKFFLLTYTKDISEVALKMNWPYKVTNDELDDAIEYYRAEIDSLVNRVGKKEHFIASYIYAVTLSLFVLDNIRYHSINEIIINYYYDGKINNVFLHTGGKQHLLECLEDFDEATVGSIVSREAQRNSTRTFDKKNPLATGANQYGSRISIAAYSVTPEGNGWSYNERIFNLKNLTIGQLKDDYKTLDDKCYDFLKLNMRGRGSIAISGSDMGIGKSTLLNALVELINEEVTIGLLDMQDELQTGLKYPQRDIKPFLDSPDVGYDDLFKFALKTARHMIIVGEITSPTEVVNLVNSILRLNSGTMFTVHSLTYKHVIQNLRNLLLSSGLYDSSMTAENDLASGLDIIAHMARHPVNKERIIIESISEVEYTGYDQPYNIKPITNLKESMNRFFHMAQLYIHAQLHHSPFRYRQLLKFNYTTDTWDIVERPTSEYMRKMSVHVGQDTVQGIIDRIFSEAK